MNYKKIFKIEPQLILFFGYVIFLLCLFIKTWNVLLVLKIYITSVIVYSLFCYRRDFLLILISPYEIMVKLFENYYLKKYLKVFKKNVPEKAVIILGQSNWFKLKAWIEPSVSLGEIKPIVKYLKLINRDFSFYINVDFEDVEKIMSNKEIREVYFVGHGNSHVFELNTDNSLYYCDFNDEKYEKDFVHQIHCGTPDGKSLIDYVVPDKNKSKCFLIRKSIRTFDIKKEFKRRIKEFDR